MTRISAMLAVNGGIKAEAGTRLAQLLQVAKAKDLMTGQLRSYRPRAEESGGQLSAELPDERQAVRFTAKALLEAAQELFTRSWDVQLTIDAANQQARADVTVGGTVLLEGVPVGHLLYLERELGALAGLVEALPVRDLSRTWTTDGQETGIARSDATQADVTKKTPFNWVKAAATDKHPAQVEVMYEDKVVGYRTTTLFSGALDPKRKEQLAGRISALRVAVKQAREEANAMQVLDKAEGAVIFGYLFGEA